MPGGFGAALRRKRFGQDEIAVKRVGETERGGGPEGKTEIDVAKVAAHRRSDNETEAEGGGDQAKLLRSFFRWRDVGDVGECGGDVGGGNPGNQAADEKPGKRRGKSHENVINAQSKAGNEDDRAAPEAIRPGAQKRRENKLHSVSRKSEIAGDS